MFRLPNEAETSIIMANQGLLTTVDEFPELAEERAMIALWAHIFPFRLGVFPVYVETQLSALYDIPFRFTRQANYLRVQPSDRILARIPFDGLVKPLMDLFRTREQVESFDFLQLATWAEEDYAMRSFTAAEPNAEWLRWAKDFRYRLGASEFDSLLQN